MPVGYITMRRFGRMGRFGNQIFQRMFCHVYARRHQLQVQLPPWVGNIIFGTRDYPVNRSLPDYVEPAMPDETPIAPRGAEVCNRDFVGWGQLHTSWYSEDREFILSLFRPAQIMQDRIMPAIERLGGRTRVAIHLRRGDYGHGYFWITPVAWYLRKLEEIWPTLADPVLFIASEDRSLVKEFSRYDPKTTDDLGIELNKIPMTRYNYLGEDLRKRQPHLLDFAPDFFMLANSHVLLAPNSSFSFVAAMLNPSLRMMYRASLPAGDFEFTCPWNASPLLRDRIENFPHLRV